MKIKCKYLKREKKFYHITISILLLIIIALFIISRDRIFNFISNIEIFDNENGLFDWGIFWDAIGGFGSILGFVGVIITIIWSEKSRIKQNKYDYVKERKISNQYDFELFIKNFLDEVDPINSSVISLTSSEENYQELIINVNCYITKIKSFYSKVQWYYDNNDSTFPKKDNFFGAYDVFIDKVTKSLNSYSDALSLYNSAILYKNYQQLKQSNMLSEEQMKQFEELKTQYDDIGHIYKEIMDKRFKELMNIVEYRNKEWFTLLEEAKEMLNEREEYIKKSLEKRDN